MCYIRGISKLSERMKNRKFQMMCCYLKNKNFKIVVTLLNRVWVLKNNRNKKEKILVLYRKYQYFILGGQFMFYLFLHSNPSDTYITTCKTIPDCQKTVEQKMEELKETYGTKKATFYALDKTGEKVVGWIMFAKEM